MLKTVSREKKPMNTITISQEAEAVLLELNDNLYSVCTRETLTKLHQGVFNIDAVLDWLLEYGYVAKCDDGYELTFSGTQMAHHLQAKAQGFELEDSVKVRSLAQTAPDLFRNRDETAPLFDTHPLRTGRLNPIGTMKFRQSMLHYMLAFETPMNALPAPVLDGDVLGRLPGVDLCLSYDGFVSGQHCRFYVTPNGDTLDLSIEDLGSRNGTFVDDVRLEPGKRYRLDHGSRIKVGDTVLIVTQIPG